MQRIKTDLISFNPAHPCHPCSIQAQKEWNADELIRQISIDLNQLQFVASVSSVFHSLLQKQNPDKTDDPS